VDSNCHACYSKWEFNIGDWLNTWKLTEKTKGKHSGNFWNFLVLEKRKRNELESKRRSITELWHRLWPTVLVFLFKPEGCMINLEGWSSCEGGWCLAGGDTSGSDRRGPGCWTSALSSGEPTSCFRSHWAGKLGQVPGVQPKAGDSQLLLLQASCPSNFHWLPPKEWLTKGKVDMWFLSHSKSLRRGLDLRVTASYPTQSPGQVESLNISFPHPLLFLSLSLPLLALSLMKSFLYLPPTLHSQLFHLQFLLSI
jgi:hypothetical protein